MTPDDAYEVHRETRIPRYSARDWKSMRDKRIETLHKAIRRRIMRDVAWIMKTGCATPIRKQRTRWFSQALKRRERHFTKEFSC